LRSPGPGFARPATPWARMQSVNARIARWTWALFGLLGLLAAWLETPVVVEELEPQAAMSIEHAAAAITTGRMR
jgi:hypothetical protein